MFQVNLLFAYCLMEVNSSIYSLVVMNELVNIFLKFIFAKHVQCTCTFI